MHFVLSELQGIAADINSHMKIIIVTEDALPATFFSFSHLKNVLALNAYKVICFNSFQCVVNVIQNAHNITTSSISASRHLQRIQNTLPADVCTA